MVRVHLAEPVLTQQPSRRRPSLSFLAVMFIMTFIAVSVFRLGGFVQACVWRGFGNAGSQQQGNCSSSRRQQ
jgi:hypothetical protein